MIKSIINYNIIMGGIMYSIFKEFYIWSVVNNGSPRLSKSFICKYASKNLLNDQVSYIIDSCISKLRKNRTDLKYPIFCYYYSKGCRLSQTSKFFQLSKDQTEHEILKFERALINLLDDKNINYY